MIDESAAVKRLLRGERAEIATITRARSLLDRQEQLIRERYHTLRLLVDVPEPTAGFTRDPHQQAGFHNVNKVLTLFKRRPELTGRDIAQKLDLSSGTVTWACKALIADGEIEDTGEWRATPAGGTAKVYRRLPRTTRLEPGT